MNDMRQNIMDLKDECTERKKIFDIGFSYATELIEIKEKENIQLDQQLKAKTSKNIISEKEFDKENDVMKTE